MKNITGQVEYEIVVQIAEGGMGAVYKALKKGVQGFEKIVAIKTLLDCYSQDQKFVTRFIAEAKLVANLVHENIVQIYELDKFDGNYFFVLEFVNGISLYDFMEFLRKARTRFPKALAVFVTSRIARGLAYAHSRLDNDGNPLNIVHCDVCPHNILINTEGLPKLADFGIAKAVNVGIDDSISGKLPFMSPEQANNAAIDFRSDIYSLGMVLFYMLCTGRTARVIDAGLKEIYEQAKKNIIDWNRLPGDMIDEELSRILKKMLATDPDERYQDTAILARELEYYIYKDGYGPTIVTLANYMKEQMPALFDIRAEAERKILPEKTIIMDRDSKELADPAKTVKLPVDYFENKA